jgi:hypothetical protein
VLAAARLPALARPGGVVSAPIADAGLWERFRVAGTKVQWRPIVGVPKPGGRKAKREARIAHLHDEEARVESEEGPSGILLRTDSGPVGALVLLLEIDRRGVPMRLEARAAGEAAGFAQGALEAEWVPGARPVPGSLPLADLVALARYALA